MKQSRNLPRLFVTALHHLHHHQLCQMSLMKQKMRIHLRMICKLLSLLYADQFHLLQKWLKRNPIVSRMKHKNLLHQLLANRFRLCHLKQYQRQLTMK